MGRVLATRLAKCSCASTSRAQTSLAASMLAGTRWTWVLVTRASCSDMPATRRRIAQSLSLREPKYQETAAYCHFGREAVTKNGIKFFEWENAKDLSKFKSMDGAQV